MRAAAAGVPGLDGLPDGYFVRAGGKRLGLVNGSQRGFTEHCVTHARSPTALTLSSSRSDP
jgi:hypothetical protein